VLKKIICKKVLIDTQYLSNSKRLVVSYVDKTGEIKLKYYEWEQPKKYVVCEPDDKDCHPIYKSWDGKHVKLEEVNHPDRYATYEFLDALPEEEKKEIFEYNLPKIYFVDIETEIVDGFPDAETAPTKVLSISIVYDDKIMLLGLRDMPEDMQLRIKDKTNEYFKNFKTDYKFKYIKYDDEFDMMYAFFYKMIPKMPLITGWNFVNYDWVYLVNRSRKLKKTINGKEYSIDPAVSSLTKKMNKVWMSNEEMPAHRMIFDYMQLYEICDTSIKVKESSSLDFVSSKLVGVEKIKYSGSLKKLYEDDFETFMYYNAVDSVLVQKIHEARNYISIIYAISSLSQIKIVDVISQMNNALGSLAITEGVLRNRFREQENIVLFRGEKEPGENVGIAGGWVKDPVVGMNRWCVCYDFSSLYPTVQRQWYISPENFIGVQDPKNPDFCDNGVEINKQENVICVNGVVFKKSNSPTIRMLEDVFADRKKNKKIMMNKKEELKKVLDEIKELEADL
jgi:DNA polymerase elongation subunit (family B)